MDIIAQAIADPQLWIENFITIVDKNNEEIPFVLNEQQDRFLNNITKYNVILKSRQLGFSTLSCALSLYHATTKKNCQCLLVSYTQASSDTLFYKLKQMYTSLPDIIKPKLTNNNKKELVMENGSVITCAVAGTKDLARGATLTFVHLSEYGFWGKNASSLLLGIEQALIPKGTLIIESTANGFNHFEELYSLADKGDSLYMPFFFAWHHDKFMFKEDYEQAVAVWKARHDGQLLGLSDFDETEKSLLKDGATIEQIIWRRMKIKNNGLDGEVKFRQEYPSNALEAFSFSGICLFQKEGLIEAMREKEKELDLRQINDLPKELRTLSPRDLKIYHQPEKDVKYYIGVDGAEGVGGDYSVIQVINFDAVQCLELAVNKIPPAQFADLLHAVGMWYNRGLMIIERKSIGTSLIERLRQNYNYMNLYKQKLLNYEGGGRKIGFLTTPKTKNILITDYREWFDAGELQLNSKQLIEEMTTYIMEDGGSMNAQRGKHDDRLMAFALALHGLKNGTWYV